MLKSQPNTQPNTSIHQNRNTSSTCSNRKKKSKAKIHLAVPASVFTLRSQHHNHAFTIIDSIMKIDFIVPNLTCFGLAIVSCLWDEIEGLLRW